MSSRIRVATRALSNADSLGYLGQYAVAQATGSASKYRLIGGHMVRLLQLVYPVPHATARATLDADAAFSDVEAIGAIANELRTLGFTQEKGNLFAKTLPSHHRIEINLLMAHYRVRPGLHVTHVPEIGQIDALPELVFAMVSPPLELDVTVELTDGSTLQYAIRIPDLEVAVVLKSHSWKSRGHRTSRDLADLLTLLEIREAHPQTAWSLSSPELNGYRKDAATILHSVSNQLSSQNSNIQVPAHMNTTRMKALVMKHVTDPSHSPS